MRPIWRSVASALIAAAFILGTALPGRADPGGGDAFCDHCSRHPIAYLDDAPTPAQAPSVRGERPDLTNAVISTMILAGVGLIILFLVALLHAAARDDDQE